MFVLNMCFLLIQIRMSRKVKAINQLWLMTCCHYVIFWTYFDILIEFTSNLKCPGVLKARNYEELN